MTVHNAATTATTDGHLILTYDITPNTLDTTVPETQRSNTHVKNMIVPSVCGAQSMKTISWYMTTSKAYQLPLSQIGFTSTAQMNANPAQLWYWTFLWSNQDASILGCPPANVTVRLTYYVKLLEPVHSLH